MREIALSEEVIEQLRTLNQELAPLAVRSSLGTISSAIAPTEALGQERMSIGEEAPHDQPR